jgi:TolB protein
MKTKISMLIILLMALAACAPAATLAPTETVPPLATSTLVPATLTAPAEPTVTFEPTSDTATATESTTSVSVCGDSVPISPTRRKLTVEDIHVTLEYPADWECDATGTHGYNYYSGTDGFFQLVYTAISYAKDWCEAEVNRPVSKGGGLYGTSPTMTLLQVDNQPACLVLPSDDQPEYRSAMLAVESPYAQGKYGPVLILMTYKNHVYDFMSTLKFVR